MDVLAADFLKADFEQSFSQMRDYQQLTWDICKFTFTAYTALLGAAVTCYQYSTEGNPQSSVNLIPTAKAILTVGILMGLCMFILTLRIRTYFVRVARYVNEHRQWFLSHSFVGFKNISEMYTDPQRPSYFNLNSSQIWISLVIAILNVSELALLVFLSTLEFPHQWRILTATATISFIAHLLLATFLQYSCNTPSKGRVNTE